MSKTMTQPVRLFYCINVYPPLTEYDDCEIHSEIINFEYRTTRCGEYDDATEFGECDARNDTRPDRHQRTTDTIITRTSGIHKRNGQVNTEFDTNADRHHEIENRQS
jgi:hypothetical protein